VSGGRGKKKREQLVKNKGAKILIILRGGGDLGGAGGQKKNDLSHHLQRAEEEGHLSSNQKKVPWHMTCTSSLGAKNEKKGGGFRAGRGGVGGAVSRGTGGLSLLF